jgi:putative hydrolase of the HAD superfamily
MDDTILDDSGSIDQRWRAACDRYASQLPPFTPEEIYTAIRRYGEWYWSDPIRHRHGRLALEATRRVIVREALKRLGTDQPQIANDLADLYSVLRAETTVPFPGALDTLQHLREHGIRLALITNGNAILQRQKIVKHGLQPFFDTILIEGEFGAGKPDAQVYRHVLEQMNVEPAETWMVGDNLEWDVAGAQRVGIFGIWIDITGVGLPASSLVVPDRIIHSLDELVPR